MTNLTDEGLREQRLNYERLFASMIHEGLGESGGAVTLLSRKMTDHVIAVLQQVRDAAKKEERENCERIIRKRMVCEFDPRLSPMPDEKMGLCRELITAIRQME